MQYEDIKILIGRVFQLDPEDFEKIGDMIKMAEAIAANTPISKDRINPDQKFRAQMVTVARLLADYADSQ